jgi:hypothetical protein
MGQKFAAFGATGAIIAFYDSEDSPVPNGVAVIEITDAEWQSCLGSSGYTVSNGSLVPPVAPTAAEMAAQELVLSAQSMFGTGIAISSTSSPALNGTYACDQLSQMDIIAIETSINAGKGFPGGATTFNYPDVSGAAHTFTESNFSDFAAAVRDYVYALKSVLAGTSQTLPGKATVIA